MHWFSKTINYAINPSTWEAEATLYDFKATISYINSQGDIVRPCVQNQN